MKNYFTNIWAWLKGLGRLGKLDYKAGWTPARFFWPYLLNYGTHIILSGGAVVSWSRHFYESNSRPAKFMDRLMSKIDKDHGELSSPALWGTTPCRDVVRLTVTSFWAILTAAWLL